MKPIKHSRTICCCPPKDGRACAYGSRTHRWPVTTRFVLKTWTNLFARLKFDIAAQTNISLALNRSETTHLDYAQCLSWVTCGRRPGKRLSDVLQHWSGAV